MKIFLKTDRLIIKLPTLSDFDAILALNTDPAVMRFIGNGSINTPEQVQAKLDKDIAHFFKHQFGLGVVYEKATGEFVGQAGLFHLEYNDNQPANQPVKIEIGYRLCKKHWNKGYATELVCAIRDWGFKNLPVEKLIAVVDPRNIDSQKVVSKAGLDFIDIIDCYNKKVKLYQLNKNDLPLFFKSKLITEDAHSIFLPRAKL